MSRKRLYDNTLLIKSSDKEMVKDAARHLVEGEVVGFPTETVYGLGANAFDGEAVKKIFEAKGRPGDNPLICHVGDKSQIKDVVSEVTPLAQKLIDAFMPGPITVIMKKSDKIPYEVTAGLETVGVRMPSNGSANEFLKECNVPVAAPSANLSGSPSPTKASHVMSDMDGYVYAVIDGGESTFGLESTVVDCTGETPVILRPGAVTKADIEKVINGGKVMSGYSNDKTTADGETPMAPGMKYRHYAPVAKVEILDLPKDAEIINDELSELADFDENQEIEATDFEKLDEDEKQALVDIAAPFVLRSRDILKATPTARIGIFAGEEVKQLIDKLGDEILSSHTEVFVYGKSLDVWAASHGLFDGLRHLDIQNVGVILAQGFDGEGLSKAYMNRLSKAAGGTGAVTSEMNVGSRPERVKKELEDFRDTYTSSVLFVCDDGCCMSPACESIFADLIDNEAPYRLREDENIGCELYAESAGIKAYEGSKVDGVMADIIKEKVGRNMSVIVPQRAEPSIYDANDLIITMRDEQTVEILSAFPELKDRVFSLSSYAAKKGLVFRNDKGNVVSISIPDPRGENIETYKHTVAALKAWLELLFPYILKDLGIERC